MLKQKFLNFQFLRYIILGILLNASGYCLYLFITYLGLSPKTAASLLYPLGVMLGFFANKKWTFSYQGKFLGSGFRYILAHMIGYFINILMLFVMVDKLHYSHQWVQALAVVVVGGILFLLFRFFVFPGNNAGAA